MPPSEIRKEARESLKGKWRKAVCIILAYMLFTFVLGFIEGIFEKNEIVYPFIELAILLISIPVSFGLLISFMKLKRDDVVSTFGFFKDGFSNFGRSWGIAWNTLKKMLLPIVCIVLIALVLVFSIGFGAASGNYILAVAMVALYIATLIYTVSRGLLYSIAYNIGYDNPELSSKDCVKKSEELMKGNRGTLLLLELSFIGWGILAVFTLGIGLLWLAPYMQIAVICFYERLAKPEVNAIEIEE